MLSYRPQRLEKRLESILTATIRPKPGPKRCAYLGKRHPPRPVAVTLKNYRTHLLVRQS